MTLIVGNKRFSSWSLRPWLLMKQYGIPFEEKLIPLDQPQTNREILQYSPSGRVPCLVDGKLTVWDSLAIAEYLNEKFPDKQMWPRDTAWRAWARSMSCEMHSGFQRLRENLPHDLQKELKDFDWTVARQDIERIWQIWTECLTASGGPFLFKEFSIADAMFAPVVNRFVSYGVPTEGLVRKYVEWMREVPAHREWIRAGLSEDLKMPRYEV